MTLTLLTAVIVGVLMALSYSQKGLFAAAIFFISVFLGATSALAFGGTVVHVIDYPSPYAYSTTLLGLGLFSFMIVRGSLAFIEEEVDFHPLVERLGGAIAGLASGLFGVGFICICLACMPLPSALKGLAPSARQTADLTLWPCEQARQVMRGFQPLTIDAVLAVGGDRFSTYQSPPAPPLTSQPPAPPDSLRVTPANP